MNNGFQFHASAAGVSGEITVPFTDVIEVQAPSALPATGGYSRGHADQFKYKEIFSFQSANTQVTGSFSKDTNSWDTLMTSTVAGLDIMGMVQADLIVARLASRHVVGDKEPSIIPLGSHFEGLRIAGVPVEVKLLTGTYTKLDSFTKVSEEYKKEGDFKKTFDTVNFVADQGNVPEEHRRYFPWCSRKGAAEIPQQNGSIQTSMVESLDYKTDAFSNTGCVIDLPQFGKIILGQLTIDQQLRRLTMLQVDLGCSVCGRLMAGGGETNGTPTPPPPH